MMSHIAIPPPGRIDPRIKRFLTWVPGGVHLAGVAVFDYGASFELLFKCGPRSGIASLRYGLDRNDVATAGKLAGVLFAC
jgi:hypothetical protein